MKYIILSAKNGKDDHYELLREEKKLLWPFSGGKRDIKEDDLIFLYSTKRKEIKFLLKAKVVLEESDVDEIERKIDKTELNIYKDKGWIKKGRNSLFEMILIKELDKSFTLKDISVKNVPHVYLKIEKDGERSEIFKKIEKKIEELNLFTQIKSNQIKENSIKKFYLNEKEMIDFLNKHEEMHKIRDTNNIIKIKEEFYKINNGDKCERCGFSFEKKISEKYIEMHHKISFSKRKLKKEYNSFEEIKEDFEFLCANCHVIADKENQ